jgi:exodeoxyribonuclease-3
MRIATFNAASVRARLPLVLEWLAVNEPDVLAIQETKVEDDKFPVSDFEDLGYHVALHGQKSWNGVATVSRSPATNVRKGFLDELYPTDARILACTIDGIEIVNTYVPNGSMVGSDKFDYKLRWLDRFRKYLDEHFAPSTPLVWLGDVNVAPETKDVFDSPKFFGGVGHHPDEMSRLKKILEFGLTDVFRKFNDGQGQYTLWDFTIPNGVKRNMGWRIDHIYATAGLFEKCVSCRIDVEARSFERPSDHTFVIADFEGV